MSTPSLVMIPAGRKATKLYSVLPTDGTGDFTVARAGLRNEINSDLKLSLIAANVPAFNYDTLGGCPVLNTEPQATNLIKYPISFGSSYWTKSGATIQGDASTAGSELVTNGNFATDSDWTKGTGVTISGGSLNFSGVLSSVNTYQSSSIEIGKIYLVTFTISNYTSGGIRAIIGSSGFTDIMTSNGTFTAYVVALGNTTIYLQTQSGTSTYSIDNVSVKEVQGYSAPSVDFPTSAFKLVENTSTGIHRISVDGITVVAEKYSVSIYAKSDGRNEIRVSLANYFSSATDAYFNLDTKVITLGSLAENGLIETLSNGWFRCSFTSKNVASAGGNAKAYIDTALNGSSSYTGDGTSGVYLFMAQLETGSVATSPTFTDITLASEGSTTTRLADVVSGAGDVNTFNDSEGVLMAEISALSTPTETESSISIAEGIAGSNRALIRLQTNGNIGAIIFVGGALQVNMNYAVADQSINHKIAFKYKVNDFALWIDGLEVATDILGSTFTANTLDVLSFNQGNNSNPFYGNTKQIQYFNTALNDSDLETLTSWMSFSDMAIDLNYTIQ